MVGLNKLFYRKLNKNKSHWIILIIFLNIFRGYKWDGPVNSWVWIVTDWFMDRKVARYFLSFWGVIIFKDRVNKMS